jgi:hypothetical protein
LGQETSILNYRSFLPIFSQLVPRPKAAKRSVEN